MNFKNRKIINQLFIGISTILIFFVPIDDFYLSKAKVDSKITTQSKKSGNPASEKLTMKLKYIKNGIFLSVPLAIIVKKKYHLYISYAISSFLIKEVNDIIKNNNTKNLSPSNNYSMATIASFYSYKIFPHNVSNFFTILLIYFSFYEIGIKNNSVENFITASLVVFFVTILTNLIYQVYSKKVNRTQKDKMKIKKYFKRRK